MVFILEKKMMIWAGVIIIFVLYGVGRFLVMIHNELYDIEEKEVAEERTEK